MRRIEWVSPSGVVVNLTDGAVKAAPGVRITGMPQIRTDETIVPQQPGARWRQVAHGVREVAIPIVIDTTPNDSVDATLGKLARAIDPTNGDGRLRVIRHDGTARELHSRYVDSLVIDEDAAAVDVWRAALVFRAVDPYWYDSVDTSIQISPSIATGTFFPLFPLRLGESETLVDTVVTNVGDVEAWPVITVTGPLSTLEVHNVTTQKSTIVDGGVATGETVTIDTRPGHKMVVSSTTGNRFSDLDPASSLWPLIAGPQVVRVEFTGSSPGVSSVQMVWRSRWLTA